MAKYKGAWIEDVFKFLGFELIHDGQKNPSQIDLPPEEVRFFTRKYQLRMNGDLVKTYVKFIYDRRKGECIDFRISGKDKDGISREQIMRLQRRA